MLIDIDDIKLHLRIDDDQDAAVDYELTRMYDAAVDYCCNFCDCDIEGLMDSVSDQTLKPSVRQAILLMIGDFYENREALARDKLVHNTSTTVERLLHFNRRELGI